MLKTTLLVFGVSVLILLTLGILFLIRAYYRDILLLDEYIVLQNWFGLPKPYKYDQIVRLEACKIKTDNGHRNRYTVIFSDGRKACVYEDMREASSLTVIVKEKTGLGFYEIET